MAAPPGTLRVGRYLLALLGLVVVLYSLISFPGQRHTPKLGIDLVGGIRVVFTAVTEKGLPAPDSSQMSQARQILEDRINSTGVTGSTVVVQGSNQLVVEIPNGTGTDVAKLGKAAVLNFRGLLAPVVPVTCVSPTATPSSGASTSAGASSSVSPSTAKASSGSSKSPGDAAARPLTAPTSSGSASVSPSSTAKATGTAATSATPSGSATSTPAATPCQSDPLAVLFKADPTLKAKMPNAESCPSPGLAAKDCRAYSALSATQQQAISAALAVYDCSAAQDEADIANQYYVACGNIGNGVAGAFLLGHVIVKGQQISSANAQAPSTGGTGGTTEWTVALTLSGSGGNAWNAWTTKYNSNGQQNVSTPIDTGSGTATCGPSATYPCSDFVGFTLDGQVISYPITVSALDTQTQISGGFTQSSANALAKELNYGKLPISFHAQDYQTVSATLGNNQLHAAFLAGGIGLALVIIYSLLYYRGLGLVTIASLIVSAVLTYAMLVILGTQMGFTLDLSGIAGFIVALGITADSFVVFFERIKDEVHEGRSLRVAVPRAWVRARRTVLSADTVSFLAAAILYYFASADVKGFAFTLGMSTILDLVVVFLFTHPVVSLLSRSRAFGSPRFTGLNSVREGGISTTDSDDELPGRRQRPARAGRPTRPGGAKAGTAVLDAPEEAPEDLTDEDLTDKGSATPEDTTADEGTDETPPEASASPPESGPRRRSTPEPGTAAERAAARRARMREQGKGES